MEPQNLRFGGGVGQSFCNPLVLIAIAIAGLLLLAADRKKSLGAFLCAAILIPPDQVLYLGAVHFPMLRILALCGLARICYTKKTKRFPGGLNAIDKAMLIMGAFILIDGIALWKIWAEAVFQFGNLISLIGVYFVVRFLVQDKEDIRRAICVLAIIAFVEAFVMLFEQATGRNLIYSTLGGARAAALGKTISSGEDQLRSAGSFGHPILAGTFGAIILPLFLGLWMKWKADRKYAALGVLSCAAMAFSASSSTALLGFMGGAIGFAFWPLRRNMRIIRWGIVVTLVALHIYMTMPVWHLISDIDLTGSSSSYHRYQLINQCIVHFSDWAVVGTKNYADWGWDMWDLSNQYVAIADQCGFVPFAAFLTVVICGFRYVGKARRFLESVHKWESFAWALGAAMFANVVAFFGTSYWDQTIVGWYLLLAMISVLGCSSRQLAMTEGTMLSQRATAESSFHESEELEATYFASRFEFQHE